MGKKADYLNMKRLIEIAAEAHLYNECAKKCREALKYGVKGLYAEAKKSVPKKASLLELLHSDVVYNKVPNPEIIKDLDYVRIVGMNAEHNQEIKKNQATIALANINNFYEILTNPDKANSLALPNKTEFETRQQYIDLYLNEAGWEILGNKGDKESGKAGIEIQVEGMPNKGGIGFCDYVLYGRDCRPLAIVEAKKTMVDPEKGRHQVDLYGDCMQKIYGYKPVLYYTNGYEIKVIDGVYPDRKISAFHTLSDLELIIQMRNRESISDLSINENITNRYYQKTAITKMCEHLNGKHRRGLLVMATGTGKTRVAISLVDVLTRNNWIRNVLFLADRITLVSQARRNFAKLLPNMSICEISNTDRIDYDARLMFSTYQTMINYIDKEEKIFSPGRFDLIIIDEAHRSIFNKYGIIFKYFDSLLVGLTATPKDEVDSNTYNLFGCESGIPDYDYSLGQAVKDKYLVKYKTILRTPKRLIEGVPYDELSEEDKRRVEESYDEEPPEIIPSNEIFKYIYNKDTCRKVLEDLMSKGLKTSNGEKIGKTIIFAYNHNHAQMIVDCFYELYPKYEANYCQLVDYQVNYSQDLVNQFSEKETFRIAVSVDMLDTGVDVPEVLNLVFFKPVKSRIKFIQMIGRGTRLCPNIFGPNKDKEYFNIFDYCGNFEYFGINPEGSTADQGLSLSQRLFEVKLDILFKLQNMEYQENEYYKSYYDELKDFLIKKVQGINRMRFQARDEIQYVECYSDINNWVCLSPVNVKEIKNHITYLLDGGLEGNAFSLGFDALVLMVEKDLLTNNKILGSAKKVKRIRQNAQFLMNEKASIPAVMAKKDILKKVVDDRFWESPSVNDLESIRVELRELMQFLDGSRRNRVNIDIEEIIVDSDYTVDDTDFDIKTYREKVIDYLEANSNNAVIVNAN